MDSSVLNHVGRDEDDERIEFGCMHISFYLMNFPNTFAFLFHLGLPGSMLSVLRWLAGCLRLCCYGLAGDAVLC